MDSLHTVLRSIRETKARRDHLDIFREFLGHLDRIGRRAPACGNGEAAESYTLQDEVAHGLAARLGPTSPRLRGEADRA
jgi:hypothetical protein